MSYRCDFRTEEKWRWTYGTSTDEQTARDEAAAHRASGQLVRLVRLEGTGLSPLESVVEDDTVPTLYVAPQLPEHWVAVDAGTLYFWPARADGWREAKPYLGHVEALVRVDAHNAIGTGWPGYRASEQ